MGISTSLSQTKIKEKYTEFKEIFGANWRAAGLLVRTDPKTVIGRFFTAGIQPAFPLFEAWMLSKVIDELINVVENSSSNLADLIQYAALFLLSILIYRIVRSIDDYLIIKIQYLSDLKLESLLTGKLQSIDIQQSEDPEVENLIRTVRENSYAFRSTLRTISILPRPIVGLISTVAILFSFSPLLALVLTVSVIPGLFINVIVGERKWGMWAANAELKRNFWSYSSYASNTRYLKEIKIFNLSEYFRKIATDLLGRFQGEQMKVEQKRLRLDILSNIIEIAGYVYTYLKIFAAAVARTITIGQVSFYISTANNFRASISSLLQEIGDLYSFGLFVRDTFKLLDLPSNLKQGDIVLEKKDTPPQILLRKVNFTYPGTDTPVLKNLNLTINPGENIAIVGENGAGKTTLINLLMRFYDTTDGQILVDDTDLRNLNKESWYSKVGTLFQRFNTYHFDAKTNIGIGNIEKINDFEGITEAAKKAGAHDFIQKYKHQYSQVLDKSFEDGITPSYGQWQKIAIARVFFKNPQIIILDEPTSAIDPKAEAEIFDRLFEFAAEKTVIIISHRFSTVRNASRIIVLDDGEIVEQGTHEQLMAIEGGKYKTAFEIQRRGYE